MSAPFPDREVKPFRTRRVARYDWKGEELALKDEMESRRHGDVFGAMLLQQVADIQDTVRALCSDSAYRKKVGSIQAVPFAELESLDDQQRKAAFEVCEYALLKLAEMVAGTLSAGERAYPGGFCIEYALKSNLMRVSGASSAGVKLQRVSSCEITEALSPAEEFPRWLKSYREKQL